MDNKLILLGWCLLCCFFGKIETGHAQQPEAEVVLSVEEYKEILLTLIEAKRRRAYLRAYGTLPPTGNRNTARSNAYVSPALDSLQYAIYELEERLRAERLRDRLMDTDAKDDYIGLNLPPRAQTDNVSVPDNRGRSVDSLEMLLAEIRQREARSDRYAWELQSEPNPSRSSTEPIFLERGRDTIYLENPYRRPDDRYEYRQPALPREYAYTDENQPDNDRRRYERRTESLFEDADRDRTRLQRELSDDYRRSRQETEDLRREIAELRQLYNNRTPAPPNFRISPGAVQPLPVYPQAGNRTDTLVVDETNQLGELIQRMAMMEARMNVELAAAQRRDLEQQNQSATQSKLLLENRFNESQREVLKLQAQVAELQRKLAEKPEPAPPPPTVVPVPVPVPTTTVAAEYIARNPMTTVYFANGSSAIGAEGRRNLDRTIGEVRTMTEIQIVIRGFTSTSGSLAVNQRLARERAEAVRQYLDRQGIAPNRIRVDPVGIDTGAASSELARRAEVVLQLR